MSIYLILISLFLTIYQSQSCGISTHIEIAHRAAAHYDHLFDQNLSAKKLIEKFQSAFQAGNPYPDSYYPSICKKGTLADVSEDTHWVPFLNATIEYIQKTYKRPFNEDAQRLIVFTLGYISHQMADVTWHSLGVQQGFLSSMGYVNFHGSFSQAHSVGDFGGDVVNQFELDTKYISDLGEWYVPYNDLYNIYLDLYGAEKITKADIIECSSLLFLGRLGEQVAVSLLYADYFKKSAFMTDRLNDFFLGGLDDMATWTQISWNKFFYMLENGLDKCDLDHNIMFIDCNDKKNKQINSSSTRKHKTHKSIEADLKKKVNLDSTHYDIDQTNQGVYIRPSLKYRNYFKSNFVDNVASQQESNSTYYVLNDNAQLGWSMATGDLDNNGHDDLIIGAPVYSELNSYQNGAVFALTSQIAFENLNLQEKASFVIKPPPDVVSSRFGHSVAILDINLDGYNDIVVSAPSYDLHNIKYQGQVFIYFGDKNLSYKEPNVTIICHKFKYCNLGWKMSIGDVNLDGKNDLIISSPFAATCADQCGFVSVLFSKNQINSQIDIVDSDWFLVGKMAYEWFGFSLTAKYGYLMIGAPQARKCYRTDCQISDQDIQSVGRVYVYKYPNQKQALTLNGNEEWAQFGYDFDLSYQNKRFVVAVSSPTEDTKLNSSNSFDLKRAGVVRIFSLAIEQQTCTLLSVIKSDRPYSAFGSKLVFHKYENGKEENLFISAQMRSQSIVLIDHIQEGMIFEFEGGRALLQNFTDQCSLFDLHPCPLKHSKVFSTTQIRSRFGFDFVFPKVNNKTILAASSIHSNNQKSRLSGQIKLFSL